MRRTFFASIVLAVSLVFTPAGASVNHYKPIQIPQQWHLGYMPTTKDPVTHLPPKIQRAFACIRWTESRGHIVDGDYPLQEGLYQFAKPTWEEYATRAHVGWYSKRLHSQIVGTPNMHTGPQQGAAAAEYWKENHNLGHGTLGWGGDLPCIRILN